MKTITLILGALIMGFVAGAEVQLNHDRKTMSSTGRPFLPEEVERILDEL